MSRDSGIAEDPEEHFPQPEIPQNLRYGSFSRTVTLTLGRTSATEELSDRTSANIKLGTDGTGRIPRVRFHLWRNLNSSENFDIRRFSDCKVPSLAVRQSWHLRMMMGEFPRKFELPRWRIIAADLGNSTLRRGNSKLGISTMGNSTDVISANTHAKGLLPMHGNACENLELLPLYQIFI